MRPFVFALLLLSLPAGAIAATDVPYSLGKSSSFDWGCFGACECPVISQPLGGSFVLRDLGFDGLFERYAVLDARFTGQALVLAGSGTYKVGGEVAITQQLTLDLVVNGGAVKRFDSGLVPGGFGFPKIDAEASLHGQQACFDSVVHLVAAPTSITGVVGGVPARLTSAPNPFRAATRIQLDLPVAGRSPVMICDAAGRVIRRLGGDAELAAGPHAFDWDGRDDAGRTAPAGVYFVRAAQLKLAVVRLR